MSQYKPTVSLPSGREAGFSLLEILIALSLVAAVTAIVTPWSSRTAEATALRFCASQLTAHLNLVRTDALQHGRSAQMEIDPARGRYASAGVVPPQTLHRGIELRLRVNGGTSRASFAVTFDADGRADGADIILIAASGSQSRVSIDPLTGIAINRTR